MSAARAPRVHFTHHPCLVAHPAGETWRSAPFDAPSWVFCSYPYTSWSSAERDGTRSSLRFTTEPNPPAGRVLVARVHMMESGRSYYVAKLMAAAAPGGERFSPRIDLVRVGGK